MISTPAQKEGNTLSYKLADQIGFQLRLANQQHLEIFHQHIPDLTPTQFALMVALHEQGEASQNQLGRQIGIDAATTNGVVDRLLKKSLLQSSPDPHDKRRLRLTLSQSGVQKLEQCIPAAQKISAQTLDSLTPREAQRLQQLLNKLNRTPL